MQLPIPTVSRAGPHSGRALLFLTVALAVPVAEGGVATARMPLKAYPPRACPHGWCTHLTSGPAVRRRDPTCGSLDAIRRLPPTTLHPLCVRRLALSRGRKRRTCGGRAAQSAACGTCPWTSSWHTCASPTCPARRRRRLGRLDQLRMAPCPGCTVAPPSGMLWDGT